MVIFLIQEEVSVNIVCLKNSVFSNNNDCSLMICFLSVLLEESRN